MAMGAIVGAFADIKTRRIPNLLTGVLAAIAIAVNIPNGIASIAITALVMMIVFLAGSFTYSLGWFGGGDVKLIAACCGFAGFPGSIELLLYVFIAGGVVCFVESLRQKRLKNVLVGAYQSAIGIVPVSSVKVPYGVAIAAGSCIYALSTAPLLHFLRFPL